MQHILQSDLNGHGELVKEMSWFYHSKTIRLLGRGTQNLDEMLNKTKGMHLKLNISKAYDRVNWDFLLKLLALILGLAGSTKIFPLLIFCLNEWFS